MSSSQFTIDAVGNVRTAVPFLTSAASTSFVVLATDNFGSSGSATVSVAVVGTCAGAGVPGASTNRAPVFSLPTYMFTIPCAGILGAYVGSVPVSLFSWT